MKRKSDFIGLIQDETFIRLVIEASDPNKLLGELVQKNPEERDSIRYAFEFIQLNLKNKTKMCPEDYQKILNYIQDYSNRKSSSRFLNYLPRLRIAAMILVIISIGSLVAYYQFTIDPLTQFAHSDVVSGKQSVLMLSDGTKQALKENNSLIDYQSNNGEIIVKNDSNEERFENKEISKQVVLNQVVVPFGQRQEILLSDGTLVHLNAGSQLTFPATFQGRNREVYLKGEGFFEVSKNAEVPFIVKTDHIDIKVLGTRFNVSAYDDEPITSAVLVEGKVNVSQKNKIFANKQYTLVPGQGCFYSTSDQTSKIKDVDVNEYVLWKDGLYNFKNLPLSDIVNRVNKYYNLSIQVENGKLSKTLVSGKLVLSKDVTEVIQYLSKTMEVRFEKSADGTYLLKQ
ncbi:MAG TPA: FecR domain-containing protein [Prolixibacteraceae bacterium]